MFKNKIYFFLLKLTLFYFVGFIFLFSLIGGRNGFGNFYSKIGSFLFSSMGDDGVVVYEKIKGKKKFNDDDYQLFLVNKAYVRQIREEAIKRGENIKQKIPGYKVGINTWQFAYLPLAFLLALVFATPIHWKRKIWGFVLAFVLMNVFLFFKLWLNILNQFQQQEWLAIGNLSVFQKELLATFAEKLFYFGTSFILAVFIWIVVCFRIEDLSTFNLENFKKPHSKPLNK